MALSTPKVKGLFSFTSGSQMNANRKNNLKNIFFMHFLCLAGIFLLSPHAWAQDAHPVEIFERYLSALEDGESDVVLRHVTDQSREMMKGHPSSAGQMELEADTLKECGEPHLRARRNWAVLYFDLKNKKCTPYFMLYEKNAWKLDLYTMSQAIRFDQNNHWKLDKNVKHPYLFAFGRKE
jgi:hypothetical protein